MWPQRYREGVAHGSELTYSVGSHNRASEVNNAYSRYAVTPTGVDEVDWGGDSGKDLPLMAATEWHGSRLTLGNTDPLKSGDRRETAMSEKRDRRLVAVGAAADYLCVSKATVERLVFRGELPIVKVSGSTRYDVDDLDNYIEINRHRNRRRTA